MARMVKTYADTYIYRTYPKYEEEIFKYLMNCQIVNKQTPAFSDAKYEVKKRAVSNAFINCMESDNVVFVHGAISKPFLVVTAKDLRQRATHEMAMQKYIQSLSEGTEVKDIKNPKNSIVKPDVPSIKGVQGKKEVSVVQGSANLVYDMNFVPYSKQPFCFKEDVMIGAPLKVFVNVDMCMDGQDRLKEPEILISLLTSALCNLLYYKMPEKLFSSSMLDFGSACFTKLFCHVLEMLAKISVMEGVKPKCEYIASKYFHNNIACTFENGQPSSNFSNSVRQRVIKDSGLSEKEAGIIDAVINDEEYGNIKLIIEAMADYLKLPTLAIDNFLEKWMYLFGGPQTAFGLEYFPNFSTMITDAYNGCYLNNQKTIEKICGNDMVGYTKGMLNTIQ